MIQTKQNLSQLIKYFKNFNFQILDIHKYPCDSDIKKVIQSYEESILNSVAMIQIFEQKNNEIFDQNELLRSEIEDLKEQVLQEQKNNEKTTQQYNQIIEKLRLQLIQKQDQCRCLTEKLQSMQAQLQTTQIELLQREDFIQLDFKQSDNSLRLQKQNIDRNSKQMVWRNYLQIGENQNYQLILENQNQQISFSKLFQLKNKYQQRIQCLQKFSLTQKQIKESLYQRLSELQTKLKKLQDQKLILSEKKTQQDGKNQTNFYNYQSENSQYRSSEQLDFRPQETSLMRDILNCIEKEPQQKYFNKKNTLFSHQIPSSLINSKNEKQNYISSISSKVPKSNQRKQKAKVPKQSEKSQFMGISSNKQEFSITLSNELSENNRGNNSPQFIHEFTLDKNQQQISRMNFQKPQNPKIKVIKKQSQHLDPYHSFFILSAQCIKMNSKYFEQIAQVDVEQEWKEVIEKRIPLNEWSEYLERIILQKARIPQFI